MLCPGAGRGGDKRRGCVTRDWAVVCGGTQLWQAPLKTTEPSCFLHKRCSATGLVILQRLKNLTLYVLCSE